MVHERVYPTPRKAQESAEAPRSPSPKKDIPHGEGQLPHYHELTPKGMRRKKGPTKGMHYSYRVHQAPPKPGRVVPVR